MRIEGISASGLLEYTRDKLNPDGGYCFYRLEEESNSSDTFYALNIYHSLGVEAPLRDKTVEFLQERQMPDGSYQGFYAAWYCLKGLSLLGERPLYDPTRFLRRHLEQAISPKPKSLAIEISSAFEPAFYSLDAASAIGRDITRGLPLATWTIEQINPDGGFGDPRSNLISTYQATSILHLLDEPFEETIETPGFIRSLQSPGGGFHKTPGSGGLTYLDDTWMGLEALRLLGERPDYPRATRAFVTACQNHNGGFRRARAGGISTLENSFYAVKSLSLL